MDNHLDQINKLLQEELQKQKPSSSKKRWLWLAVAASLMLAYFFFVNFSDKNISFSQGKTIVKETFKKAGSTLEAATFNFRNSPTPSLADSWQKPLNILLLGIPGPGNDAPDLTDTIVLTMIKPNSEKVTLISIPRDLWVKIPQSEIYTKINSLYVIGKQSKGQEFGLKLILSKVQQVTGLNIDYYVLVDVSAVKQIVDELGGINLWVEKDIYDPQFPGPGHSYQTFELKAGWRYLDGETASKYIRSRHTQAGDFDRMVRQQQVLEAIKQKLIGLHPVWDFPALVKILNNLWDHFKTDIPLPELPGLWQTAKKTSPEQIRNLVIEKENDLIASYPAFIDNQPVSALQPKAGLENYSQIQKFIEENQ